MKGYKSMSDQQIGAVVRQIYERYGGDLNVFFRQFATDQEPDRTFSPGNLVDTITKCRRDLKDAEPKR